MISPRWSDIASIFARARSETSTASCIARCWRARPRLLRYSWCGGSDADPAKGSRLDTEVTWTLTPVAGGTHVRMEHDGFMLPKDGFAYEAMRPGWGRVLDRIAGLVAEFETS